MKQPDKSTCPKCGCGEFITELNQYDILQFIERRFQPVRAKPTNDEFKIFCRDCGRQVDEEVSGQKGTVVLK
jgi:hypothetical protein